MERMKNYFAENFDQTASNAWGFLIHTFVMTTCFYGYALWEDDGLMVAGAAAYGAVGYMFFAPLLVRDVWAREYPGDRLGALAYVAYGVLPAAPYLPFWYPLTDGIPAIVAYPIALTWAVVALAMAGREHPPPPASARRSAFLNGGGVLHLAIVAVHISLTIGLFTRGWIPPGDEVFLALAGLLLSLPFTVVSAYSALKLLGR